MCNKISFTSKKDAKRTLSQIKALRFYGDTRQECRAYRCGCGAYHLTSMEHPKWGVVDADIPTL